MNMHSMHEISKLDRQMHYFLKKICFKSKMEETNLEKKAEKELKNWEMCSFII